MIVAVDFDGTLCKHAFPDEGEANAVLLSMLRSMKRKGHKVILWTCREGRHLDNAVKWCHDHGLDFDAVNENIENNLPCGLAKRKILADIYIDDRAIHPDDVAKLNKFLKL